ncbi:dephospho-CoA kinase [Sporosarcina sp. G11-34]|nr:dephospho-CoA kinase [Sporosarcina sp. G11-34]
MQMIIGLTGSIASGKSTISKMLAKKGFPIVDADEIARLVVEPGTEVIEEIRRVFGEEVLHADNTLNREKLGECIFGNVVEREKLNSIIHPAIRAEMIRQKEKFVFDGFKTIIMDIPLLFESKLQHFVEKILVVSVTPEIQKQRLMSRNELTKEEALARIGSQLPMEQKEEGADEIIYNNGTVEESEKQLLEILAKWNVKP